MHFPSKTCQNAACGKTFNRERNAMGKLQPPRTYLKRRFCSPDCAYTIRRDETHVPTQRELDMIEDVAWIIGTDTPENIAKRVGYHTVDYLVRTLSKCKANELASRLTREHNEYMAVAS